MTLRAHHALEPGRDVREPAALRARDHADDGREGAFDSLLHLAASALDVPMAAVSLVHADQQFFAGAAGDPPGHDPAREITFEGPFRRHVVDRVTPLAIDDTRLARLTAESSLVAAGMLAYAGVPLTTSVGEVLGTLCVMDRTPRHWSGRDLDVLGALAPPVMREIELEAARRRERSRADRLARLVAERTAALERANRSLVSAWDTVSRSRTETIWRLAAAIRARSGETGAHSHRMGVICGLLAERIGVDADRAELIGIASALHDVGKLAIPEAILNKEGPLSAPERTLIETHAEVGYRMLAGSGEPLLELAALMALTHHEWMDGSGYPDGLEGEDIPLEGRIAAVADVFDALTNERAYRPAFQVAEAMRRMDDDRGRQFDPRVFDSLRDGLDQILAAVEESGS